MQYVYEFICYSTNPIYLIQAQNYIYVARNPPSTGRVTPLTMPALSLSRNRMQLVTSSTSANLPRGILSSIGPALAGSDQPTCQLLIVDCTIELDILNETTKQRNLNSILGIYLCHGSHGHSGVDCIYSDLLWPKLQSSYPE